MAQRTIPLAPFPIQSPDPFAPVLHYFLLMQFGQVKAIVERALEDGVLTPEEMEEIEQAIHADGRCSDEERALLDDLYDRFMRGEIHIA